MGYVLTGYPIRPDKRRRQTQRQHGSHESKKRRRRGRKSSRTLEAESRVTRVRAAPRSLQDLPVEVLERIFVFSRDLTLMPALNSYFHRHLRPTARLLSRFMWELYTFDCEAYGLSEELGSLFEHDTNKVILIDSVFSNWIFFDFFRNNYEMISQRVCSYIPGDCLTDTMSVQNANEVLQMVTFNKPYEFPARFYAQADNFFLYRDMMVMLGGFFSFEREYEPIEEIFKWLFTQFPPFVRDYEQIHQAIALVLSMASVDHRDRVESVSPLLVLLSLLFENEDPEGLRAFVDGLFVEKTQDSRIELLETILTRWHAHEESRDCLSDPILWTEVQRLSNMAVVEIIEKCGGEPQYDIFF